MANGNDWQKYLNEQKYSECQLVSAINAAYYLRGRVVLNDSGEYEKLVDMVRARHGSAIGIERAHEYLKIVKDKTYPSWFDFTADLKRGGFRFPAEVCVWEKHYGFHSVLVIDHEPKTNAVRVTNFKHQTSLSGWIFEEDFNLFACDRGHAQNWELVKTYRVKK
jgi:hypothetical protein